MVTPWGIFLAVLSVVWWALRNLLAGIVWLDSLLGGWLAKEDEQESPLGDAHYAEWEELKDTVHADPEGWYLGFMLVKGWFGSIHTRRVYAHHELSVIGVAPPGTGKSNMAKAQAMAQAANKVRPDVTIIDPHGDIRASTLQAFLDADYDVQYINFESPKLSDKHNPLSLIRWAEPLYVERDVKQFVSLLIVKDDSRSGRHFTEFCQIVAAGMIAYKLRVTNGRAYLGDIAELLLSNPKERARIFDDMERHGNPVEKSAVFAFRDAGNDERGSFGTTMTRNMSIWLQQNFRHVTSADGFTWEQIYTNTKPVVTYICAGAGETDGAAARLIVGNAVHARLQMWASIRAAHSGPGEPSFPKDHRIIVDEVRLLGYCKGVVTAVTETRKMGMRLMMWALSLRDIYDLYDKDASALVNGCNHLIFGGGMEMSTYNDWSRAIGDREMEDISVSENEYGESINRRTQVQRLAKDFQLRNLPDDELVGVLRGLSVRLYKPFKLTGKGKNKRLEFI